MKLSSKITASVFAVVFASALLLSGAALAGGPAAKKPSVPEKPAAVKIVRLKNKSARLKWRASANAAGYCIYKKIGKQKFKKIAETAKTSYKDKKLAKKKTYKYKVTAYSTANGGRAYSAFSKTVSLAKASVFSEALVNQTKLRPMLTGHIDADNKAKEILGKITNDDMTNYQKLKAIYRYCTLSFSYSRSPRYYITSQKYSKKLYSNSIAMEIYYLDRAMTAFSTKKGACTAYSGAFVVLCDLAGFSAYIDEGGVHAKSGGFTGHTWTRINFGGTYYIFDPQVEQSNMQSQSVEYTYFAQNPKGCSRYKKDGRTLKRSISLRNKAEKVFCGKGARSVAR